VCAQLFPKGAPEGQEEAERLLTSTGNMKVARELVL
jgi:hypothetical protein